MTGREQRARAALEEIARLWDFQGGVGIQEVHALFAFADENRAAILSELREISKMLLSMSSGVGSRVMRRVDALIEGIERE